MKVKIIADSTCDLSPQLLQKYDIAVTPLSVILGERIGHDNVDIFPADIVDYVTKSGKMAKTSAVNTAEYADLYRRYTGEGCSIVQFTLSGKMSSCYKNASAAAANIPNVYVVDSRNLSTGSGLLVLHAAELAQQGWEAAAIAEDCAAMAAKVEASFVIDNLDYLYKGGRCSALSTFGANLLRIKPCIEVVDGQMRPGEKFRGPLSTVVEKYVKNRLSGRADIDLHRIFITHTRCSSDTIAAARAAIEECCPGFEEILETQAASVVTCHCGEGTLGVLFVRK